MTQYPLPFTVTRIRREIAEEVDELGNPQWTTSSDTVAVAGWAVPTSDEPKLTRHDRLTVDVELLAPSGTFRHDDQVDLPPYGRCQVIGWPENYDHGPFKFVPGLEVVNLKQVTNA